MENQVHSPTGMGTKTGQALKELAGGVPLDCGVFRGESMRRYSTKRLWSAPERFGIHLVLADIGYIEPLPVPFRARRLRGHGQKQQVVRDAGRQHRRHTPSLTSQRCAA